MTPPASSPVDILQIARVCHEANRAYCETLGDFSQPLWNDAPEWQHQSAINGVLSHGDKLEQAQEPSPQRVHEAWLKDKHESGWKYGAEKDHARKEQPAIVPYEQLPESEKLKDYIFSGIVKAFFASYLKQSTTTP